jgi:hypothetical protein
VDLPGCVDPILKGMTAITGLWLMGLMVVRTNARGKWKIIGLEWGPVFDPKMQKTAWRVALAFAVAVLLVAVRTFCAIA